MIKQWILRLALLVGIGSLITSCGQLSKINNQPQTEPLQISAVPDSASPRNNHRKIIVFKSTESLDALDEVFASEQMVVTHKLKLVHAVAVTLPENAYEKALSKLKNSAAVDRIEDDIQVSIAGRPAPAPQPILYNTWGITAIHADVIAPQFTGLNVAVGILDTGIDITHPDLKANIAGGFNAIIPNKSYNDDNGHGTHVAGTIGAVQNNFGVTGVAPQSRLYAIKVLDAKGNGYLSSIINGIDWCMKNNIKVINMSLGSSIHVSSFENAVKSAYAAGITIVCAAGNESGAVSYPAAYDAYCIAVSAMDANNKFASFSNYGPEVDFIAPGVSIWSTWKNGTYSNIGGTSMASPHVAGACAVILAKYPDYKSDQIELLLQSTATKFDTLSDLQQGAGLINAAKAVGLLTY